MSNEKIVGNLNGLLADSAVFYQKLRNYHWNVTGNDFFELHAKFEELYTRWAMHIDEVAERILMLGSRPVSSLSGFLEFSQVKENNNIKDSRAMVMDLVQDFALLQKRIFSVVELSEAAGDRKTTNVLDEINDEIEKDVWMLTSWLD